METDLPTPTHARVELLIYCMEGIYIYTYIYIHIYILLWLEDAGNLLNFITPGMLTAIAIQGASKLVRSMPK